MSLYRIVNAGVITVLAIVCVVPLAWALMTSFTPASEVVTQANPFAISQLTLDNYVQAWQMAPFLTYYLNTLTIVVGILAVQLVTITLAAYAFARLNFIGKNVLFLLFLTQIMIPPDVLIFPNYTIVHQLGLVDTKLAVMLPYWASAFGVFLLRQTFKQVPLDLEEAAKMDGCRWWQLLWHVYFPLARPTYVAFALISISTHWSNFMWPLIVTNTDASRPLTVGMAMFAQSYETGAQWGDCDSRDDYGYFAAVTCIFRFPATIRH